jgi:hypothetical protein
MKSGFAWVLGFAFQVALFAIIGFLLWQVLPVADGMRNIGALLVTAPLTRMLFESIIVAGFAAFFLAAWTPSIKNTVIVTLIVNGAFAIAVISAIAIIGPVPGMTIAAL